MGGSGTTAALAAAEEGLQVLAIDKAGKYGGTSSITTEALFVNPPKFQAEHNNGEDYTDADVMYDAWVAYGEGDAKEDIVHRMIYESGEVLDWLVYDHGVGFAEPMTGFTESDVYVTKYQWLPNDIMYNKAEIGAYFDGMWSDFEALGGTYMLETEGYELIYDEATNTVTGAKARNLADGTEYTINADAVILATGGYAGSPEMEQELLRNDYYPLNGVWKHLGSTQNDGKMLQAAMDIGAGTYNISMPPEVHNSGTETWLTTQFEAHYIDGQLGKVTGRPAFWTEGDLPANLGWSADSLAVDANGERFTSETGVSFLDPWIAGPNYYSIWSQEQLDKIAAEGFDTDRSGPSAEFLSSGTPIPIGTPVPNVADVMAAAEEAGIVVKADTIEELAEKLGMDPAVLSATVETYNGYCETGVDEQFGKPAEFLDKVGEGPYYCVIMASYCYGSCGGLDINSDMQVLAEDGETVINGLYAVGTDSMGVLFTEKKPYVTYGGANNGWGMVSGYLCGKGLGELLNQE
ncbi:MAG: FAD-binding protein [Pseudoflavonifractor capillosus]|nr:FAD-binding protein [Pseudoflavonifractor capillosus]